MSRKTVDLTPTWSDVLPAMLAVISNPDASQESRRVMYEEMGRMATYADNWVSLRKQPLDK